MFKKAVSAGKAATLMQPTTTAIIPPPTPTRSGQAIATTMMPGCCGLKVVHRINCIGNTDELSKKYAEDFVKKTQKGTADDGNWMSYNHAPETVCVISDSPSYTKPEEYARQVEFLKSKGWKEICTWESLEGTARKNGEKAMNHMWGSPGIEVVK